MWLYWGTNGKCFLCDTSQRKKKPIQEKNFPQNTFPCTSLFFQLPWCLNHQVLWVALRWVDSTSNLIIKHGWQCLHSHWQGNWHDQSGGVWPDPGCSASVQEVPLLWNNRFQVGKWFPSCSLGCWGLMFLTKLLQSVGQKSQKHPRHLDKIHLKVNFNHSKSSPVSYHKKCAIISVLQLWKKPETSCSWKKKQQQNLGSPSGAKSRLCMRNADSCKQKCEDWFSATNLIFFHRLICRYPSLPIPFHFTSTNLWPHDRPRIFRTTQHRPLNLCLREEPNAHEATFSGRCRRTWDTA